MSVVIYLAAAAAYFVPTIVAFIRNPPHAGSAVAVNFFLGWTFVGWVVALAMACRSKPPVAEVAPVRFSQQYGRHGGRA